jgi:hypothetical protein
LATPRVESTSRVSQSQSPRQYFVSATTAEPLVRPKGRLGWRLNTRIPSQCGLGKFKSFQPGDHGISGSACPATGSPAARSKDSSTRYLLCEEETSPDWSVKSLPRSPRLHIRRSSFSSLQHVASTQTPGDWSLAHQADRRAIWQPSPDPHAYWSRVDKGTTPLQQHRL